MLRFIRKNLLALVLCAVMLAALPYALESTDNSGIIPDDASQTFTETGSASDSDTSAPDAIQSTTVEDDVLSASPGSIAAIQGPVKDPGFSLTMLNVGQGLSILIQSDGHYAIYDGGGRDTSSYVVAYLKKQGVTSLDYMIASHYDVDHLSGLIGVMNTVTAANAIVPAYAADSKTYSSFINTKAAKNIPTISPVPGQQFPLGNAVITVLGPVNYTHENENDNSIVIKVTYGSFSCIMTGDAESQAESEMIAAKEDLSANLYVAGHHGSSSSSSPAFLKAVHPSFAFISAGKDNSYGHPTAKTLNDLSGSGIQIFRTDIQGEVSVVSDGKSFSFSQAPCNDLTPGTPVVMERSIPQAADAAVTAGGAAATAADTRQTAQASMIPAKNGQLIRSVAASSAAYVVNISSLKFHKPGCSSVSKMAEKNTVYTDMTRDELISKGIAPCKNCNP